MTHQKVVQLSVLKSWADVQEAGKKLRGAAQKKKSVVDKCQAEIIKIKEKMADQYSRSNEIRDKMEILVSSTTDIRGAIGAQDGNMKALLELIENLKGVIRNNQEIVQELQKAIGKFKL